MGPSAPPIIPMLADSGPVNPNAIAPINVNIPNWAAAPPNNIL